MAEGWDRDYALAEEKVAPYLKSKLAAIDEKLTDLELEREEHSESATDMRSAMRIILTKVPGVDRRRKASANEPLVALYLDHKGKLKEAEASLVDADVAVKRLEKERVELLDTITPGGKFLSAINFVYKELRVNKRAYHSQSWVGPDISKLLNPTPDYDPANLFEIALSPQRATTPSGAPVTIGDVRKVEQVKSLLISFREVRSLYSRVEPLCDHQLARFDSLVGKIQVDYFTLFPGDEGTPKMHTLGYHYGDIMRIFGSVGQFTEQVIEAYHVVDKRMKERFANVADSKKQQECRINVASHTAAAKLDVRAKASASGAKSRAVKKMFVASQSRAEMEQ